jgi:hypothetical protein
LQENCQLLKEIYAPISIVYGGVRDLFIEVLRNVGLLIQFPVGFFDRTNARKTRDTPETTAITAATPITTPISVSTLRSLCAHRLDVAIETASPRCHEEVRVTIALHSILRVFAFCSYAAPSQNSSCRDPKRAEIVARVRELTAALNSLMINA